MEQRDEVESYSSSSSSSSPKPFRFCTKLLSLQAEILYTCIISLASPFFYVIDFIFRGRRKGFAVGGGFLLGRIAVGLLAAAYVCMVLVIVMIVAAAVGVGLVRAWMEEPVYVTETLHFDYTDAHPTAFLSFRYRPPVPVGHTLYVSLLLLMPDSDYNRDVGIFQLSAELRSFQGELITRSSHPSMLVFRSWPIRYTRTFLMGVPLLLGIITGTQRITFPILKHKEVVDPRTEHVRITLFPRAGTSALPQFYDAQILVKSRPPWIKEVVYNWKLTFCVWTTMCIFVMLVTIVLFFLKPISFPAMAKRSPSEQDASKECQEADLGRRREERELSESLKRWQRSRSKRKADAAALLHWEGESSVCSSASTITDSHGEGSGDSESVCS